jgi:hypothetical protein
MRSIRHLPSASQIWMRMTELPDVFKPLTTCIDAGNDYDVMLWALVLGVDSQTVVAAVTVAGADALAVQRYLIPAGSVTRL